MTAQADLWDRFGSAEFWWMHAMVCVWALFVIAQFVSRAQWARCNDAKARSGSVFAHL